MERVVKPLFQKDEKDELFYRIRGRVNQVVAALEPKYRKVRLIKALLFPLLYITLYIIALTAGRDLVVLYG